MNAFVLAKMVHVTCVAVSIAGFVARFSAARFWPEILRYRAVRVLPHVNDTLLLAAAIVMLIIARWNVLDMPWLLAKIVGLLVYIVLGVFALRGRSARVRASAFVCALLTFAYVVSVALSKSVAGPFAG